jgi:uncharacterized protein
MNDSKKLPAEHGGDRAGRSRLCTAFAGQRCIASGELAEVARATKVVLDRGKGDPILIFDDATSELIEIDFRGTPAEVVKRLAQAEKTDTPVPAFPPKRSVGRPKLGVLAREVTLLPGHWEWLDGQPNGASAALRRLVHAAKQAGQGQDRARQAQEAVYRFMTTMAGDLPGYEEALRAFYRRNREQFDELVAPWPRDIRIHLKKLAEVARHTPA